MEMMDDYVDTGSAVALTAVAGVAAAYYLTRPRAIEPLVPLDSQSVPLDDQPGAARVSRLLPLENCVNGEFLQHRYDDCRTVYDVPRHGLKEASDGRCLGWRDDEGGPYHWICFSRFMERAHNFGCGLLAAGLGAGQGTLLGIYAQNRVEWVVAEHACYCFSMVSVALYDTLGPEACEFIVTHGSISTVVVDSEQRAVLLLERRAACLRHIVHVGPLTDSTRRRAEEAGVKLTPFEQVEALGVQNPVKNIPPRPTDVATISYTSGTTGEPKGVMLTHAAILANVSAVLAQMGPHALCRSDVMLSFLPLSHTLERMCNFAMMMVGGSVGFYRGDIRLLMDDLQTLQPTTIPAVPRIFNRIYDKVQRGAAKSAFKSVLLRCALWAKERELSAGVARADSLWDRFVLSPVRRSLGGRLRVVVIGSAPISATVLTFMRAALGCIVLEGYGQTECVCPCTLTMVGDHSTRHVGAPLPCCAIRLADVEEMGYVAAEGRGEVCVRGPTVFKGYYRSPEQTAEVLDEEGWLHTGDIGEWLPNGTLRIIDRKKNIFKLSQGEYVAPERLEDIFSRAPLVSQVYVHGDSLKSCLVAVVVPEKEALRNWALQHGFWEDTAVSELCQSDQLKADVKAQLTQLACRAGLKGFEKVRDVFIHPEPMTMQNGMLTATMKSRRHAISKTFSSEIAQMYSKLD